MEKMTKHTSFYLRRGNIREWFSCYQLDHFLTIPCANQFSISGMIFRCDRLAAFFYGDQQQDLRALVGLAALPKPDLSEVIIEAWTTDDRKKYTFEHFFRLYNVSVVNFKHTGDCICCCGGEVEIKFDKIEICEADKSQIILDKEGWLDPDIYFKEQNAVKTLLAKE